MCLFACALYCVNVYKVKLCIIIVFYCFIQVTGHDFQHVLVLNIQSLVCARVLMNILHSVGVRHYAEHVT